MIELENRAALASELQSLANDVLQYAKQCGATAAEVNLDKGMGLSAEVRMGNVDKLEYHRDQEVSVTVYFGHQKGYAASGDLAMAALQDTVNAACRIAKYTSEDTFNGLADAELMAQQFPDLDLYHPWALNAEQAIERAKEAEDAARAYDARIVNSDGSSVSGYASLSVYANTHGFNAAQAQTHHSTSCVMVGKQDDAMQRDYWYSVARAANDLASANAIGIEAAERTVRRLGARPLSTRQVPVLFPPALARGLIGNLISAVGGMAQYRKSTFLPNSLGQTLFPSFVQLREDPFIARGFASRAYDSEGVATAARDIVRDGVLQGYFLGSYSARKLGMQSTASASGNNNLVLTPTGQSFDQLLEQLGTGLLLNELIGNGTNMMTGDYSRGAAGFWVENGVIQYPVEEITIASNLKDMFKNIVAIGSDVDIQSGVRTGSILLSNMMIAGQ